MQHQNGGDPGENRFITLIVTCITQELNSSIFERVVQFLNGFPIICSINRRNNSFKIVCVLFVYWLQEERSIGRYQKSFKSFIEIKTLLKIVK